jgi:hypothetical protein
LDWSLILRISPIEVPLEAGKLLEQWVFLEKKLMSFPLRVMAINSSENLYLREE